MRLEPTPLPGVMRVESELISDARGGFARTFCRDSFLAAGIDFSPLQMSRSVTSHRGTLRGLHWQAAPSAEAKLVRVARGAVFDVVADVRPDSATYGVWAGVELSAENGRGLYIPAGFAHGFLSLTDDVEAIYAMDAAYAPDAARGARFDDPALAIEWPFEPFLVSAVDLAWPRLPPAP